MTFLESAEKAADALATLTRKDLEKRAYILVAVDDHAEAARDNTLLAVAGKSKVVQLLLEHLLKEEELSSTMERAMLSIIARQVEQERNFDINDLLKELKNEN